MKSTNGTVMERAQALTERIFLDRRCGGRGNGVSFIRGSKDSSITHRGGKRVRNPLMALLLHLTPSPALVVSSDFLNVNISIPGRASSLVRSAFVRHRVPRVHAQAKSLYGFRV